MHQNLTYKDGPRAERLNIEALKQPQYLGLDISIY